MRKILLFLMMVLWAQGAWATTYCTDASISSCWLMDNSSGNLTDSSGNSNTLASWYGSATYSTTGKFGTSVTLSGSPFYMSGVTETNMKPSLPITIVGWFYPTTVSVQQNLFGNEGYLNNVSHFSGAFMTLSSSNHVVCGYGDNTANNSSGYQIATGTATIAANTWVHIACTIQGSSNIQIYVNGSADSAAYSGSGGAMAYRGNSTGAASDWPVIGRDTAGAYSSYAGRIDELAQFSRVLSSTEINNIMNNGLQSAEGGGATTQTVTFNGATTKVFNGTTIY